MHGGQAMWLIEINVKTKQNRKKIDNDNDNGKLKPKNFCKNWIKNSSSSTTTTDKFCISGYKYLT